MRKFLLAASAGLLCICTSCNNDAKTSDETKDNSMAQKNLAASNVIDKAFETGDVSGVDSVVAEDFVDHTDHGEVRGRDSLKAMIKMSHEHMKDMKMEKVHELADNDYVFSWMHFSGTGDGSMGMPSGPMDMHGLEMMKFKDGKISEHWEYADMQEMMKMMQQMKPMDMKMDTTKMKSK